MYTYKADLYCSTKVSSLKPVCSVEVRGHVGSVGKVMQVEAPLRLQRLPRGGSVQSKAVVDPHGRPASTSLVPLAHLTSGAPSSLVLAQPFTGRTHQVRCHLGHLGHPLRGDALYGSKAPLPWHLHCAALSFREPLRAAEPPWRTVHAPWPCWARKGREVRPPACHKARSGSWSGPDRCDTRV